jgi:hypothetical protein
MSMDEIKKKFQLRKNKDNKKKVMTKFDIKIKCQGMKLKKINN